MKNISVSQLVIFIIILLLLFSDVKLFKKFTTSVTKSIREFFK